MGIPADARKHPSLPVWSTPDGRVFGRSGELKTRNTTTGYKRFNTVLNGEHVTVNVHRVIAETFIGPGGPGLTVNHKDGVKQNNRLENLEYITAAANITHAFRLGLVGTCIPIEYNGVRYHSLRECERQTGVPRKLVRKQMLACA